MNVMLLYPHGFAELGILIGDPSEEWVRCLLWVREQSSPRAGDFVEQLVYRDIIHPISERNLS